MDSIKKFYFQSTTSKTNQRIELIKEVVSFIQQKSGITPAVLQACTYGILQTLDVYHDSKSRKQCLNLVKAIIENNSDAGVNCIVQILERVSKFQVTNTRPSRSESAKCVVAMTWCNAVIENYLKEETNSKVDWKKLMEIQAALFYGAQACMKKSVSDSGVRTVKRIWKKVPSSFEKYASALMVDEPTLSQCVLLTALYNYDSTYFQTKKTEVLNVFTKSVILRKAPVPSHALKCCHVFTSGLDHQQFESIISPALQKSLLRNPEKTVLVMNDIIANVGIDLSRHAMSLMKMLTKHLISNTDPTRESAARVVSSLALQCSDAAAVQEVVKHLFGILKGSEGRLTVAGVKITVINALGCFGSAPFGSGNSALSVVKKVILDFLSYLPQENLDSILIALILSLSKWCACLSNEIPQELLTWLVKMPSLKTSTPPVRTAYIECMISMFKTDNFNAIEPLLPYLLQSVEKANLQQTQLPLATEALYASSLLVKADNVEFKKPPKTTSFWNIILDGKNSLFVSDKFLQNASDNTISKLVELITQLFLDHSTKLNADIAKLFNRALIYFLLTKTWNVFSLVKKAIKKLLLTNAGIHYFNGLMDELSEAFDSDIIQFDSAEDEIEARKLSCRCCRAFLCCTDMPELKHNKILLSEVAMRIIIDAHRPCITFSSSDFFVRFLSRYYDNEHDFVKDNLTEIVRNVINVKEMSQAHLFALKSVVTLAPASFLPHVTKRLLNNFDGKQLHQVSKREFGIMNTADGELWNMEIIDSFPKVVENKTMKRESKAYSFQDQLMEIELRKELEEKKKKKVTGGVKDPGGNAKASRIPANLTKKQQEIVDQEIEKEKEIRARIKEIDNKFENSCQIFRATIQTAISSDLLLCNFAPLVNSLLRLLQSPLGCKRAQDLFVHLSSLVMSDELALLGKQIAYTTLRIYEPIAPVDESWCFEPLDSQVLKILDRMSRSFQSDPQDATIFCFFFPFLEKVLENSGSIVKTDTVPMLSAINILLVHVRNNIESELLPKAGIITSMARLIGTCVIEVQELASDVLTATCQAAKLKQHTNVYEEIKVLLSNLLSPISELKMIVLEGLITIHKKVQSLDDVAATKCDAVRRVWVAMHDEDEVVKDLAIDLWKKLRYKALSSICTELLNDIVYHEPTIQRAAASSLHEALTIHLEVSSLTLQCLLDIYFKKRERLPPVLDEFGRVLIESPPDDFQSRIGIAVALKAISPDLPEEDIETLFTFFLPDALCDPSDEVRNKMLEAAVQAVNDHGKNTTSILLPIFEKFLRQAPNSQQYDDVRQSAVILLGTLAKHLDKGDPKIKPIVAKLTETLSTPSQIVQEAVANCLPSLVSSIKSEAPQIVRKLLVILIESNKYGERRGAAYGLAGLVKGLGIISFKQLDIMTTLTEAIQDKKDFKRKEGALMAFEMFCKMLGRLFEPYIVHVLPHLLLCFGDGNAHVRKAANDTSHAVMANLSAHGVRLVLPSLLTGLKSEDSWRTKAGSAELLGAMAFCAPKQLSSCLPSIVPQLCEILTDSHPKVQKAGEQALKKIGSVIRNPEIKAIGNVLQAALTDPHKISKCLNKLLNTKFVHFIDAPSLALILPVVQRSFRDNSTETRKMAAQIIGNMYSLTDEKDLKPYLPSVVPGLKGTLLDPMPEVRAIASKALGAMVRVSGESQFEELMPWLIEHLTSEQTSVDRSGAAQGMSEVLASLGPAKLSKFMPEIVKTANSDNIPSHVRDGYIMLFVYLPLTFGDAFIPYISAIVQPLLKALADENEYVRATALTAGQRIISSFSENSITVLLPQLEKGLFDENWRIRLSSVQLVGDLLYHVSGVTGKMSATGDDDENYGTAESFKSLEEKLGLESRDLALSGLYMGRCDVTHSVRQAAVHVWKIVVPNTPRVLREIIPTLFKLLLGCLASPSFDKRQIAARTLGEIVRKLGERMLPELIPILQRGLESDDPLQREGVCIGLTEIVRSCSRESISGFTSILVPTVQKALCDPLPDVRAAASSTFDNLHTTLGSQVLDKILPPMLELLNDEENSEAVVDGLKQIISVKGQVVLPFVVPKLLEPPVDTKILSFFAAVAGPSLTKHLSTVIKTLIDILIDVDGTDKFTSVQQDTEKVLLSVQTEHGMRIVVDDLLLGVKNPDPKLRYVTVLLLYIFCKKSTIDYSDYVSVFIQTFIKLLADSEPRVQSQAWDALAAVTSSLDAADLQQHVSSLRHALRHIRNEDVVIETGTLPGFCLPKKGLSPILPMFREGILNGSPDLKEQTAKAIGESIKYLTPAALKPSVVGITGPLIRILGDRFSWNVKLAVLETLSGLLEKVGVFLKPFLPQLQTTFTKALQDPNRAVRLQAGKALANLCSIHTRIDPLFTDLANNIRSSDDAAIRETLLQAMRGCIRNGGTKIGDKIKTELVSTLTALLSVNEDRCRSCAAACLGVLCSFIQDCHVTQLLEHHALANDPSASWPVKQGRSTLFAIAIKESFSVVVIDSYRNRILTQLTSHVNTDRVQVVTDGIHAGAYLLYHFSRLKEKVPLQVADAFKSGLEHSSSDIKIEAARSISWCMQQLQSTPPDQLSNGDDEGPCVPLETTCYLLSLLLSRTAEKNTGVRSGAEHAIASLLKLREGDYLMQQCLKSLNKREISVLQELCKQKLKKLSTSTEVIEEIDNTLIKS